MGNAELHRYPNATELRRLLATEHQLAPESVVLGNGSDELISLLCSTFASPREGAVSGKILFPTPTFSVYPIAAKSAGVECCEVPLSSDFELDVEAMAKAIKEEQPNLVFLARPNNPTGTFWSEESLLRLAVENSSVLFVSDEAYGDYGAPSSVDKLEQFPNLLVLRTLSKVGLAALRVGYLCGDKRLCSEVNKVRGPYNIGSLNLRAAMYLLSNHREWMRTRCAEVVESRDELAVKLRDLGGLKVFSSSANFLLVRVLGGVKACAAVYDGLAEREIWVRRFSNDADLADCLRITVGTPSENSELVSALVNCL